MASSHHDRMRGPMLFCPGVTFCYSKQSLKWYESPIDRQHKYVQNLKRIMRQSLIDVGLSIARPSDLLWWLYTLWITLLQYCGCWWPGNAMNEVIICHCSKPFNPEHPDLNTRTIDYLKYGLLNGSVYHLLEIIRNIPSQWLAFQTNPNIPKELKQVTTTAVWFSPGSSNIRRFHPWFWLATIVPLQKP